MSFFKHAFEKDFKVDFKAALARSEGDVGARNEMARTFMMRYRDATIFNSVDEENEIAMTNSFPYVSSGCARWKSVWMMRAV